MRRLAIVGAGIAGLAAAWALRSEALEVTLFEQRAELSGRAASRRAHGAIYDPGAQYFKTATPGAHEVVLHQLPTDELVDIGRPVWVFDGAGTIRPGDPTENAAPKWVYRDGISRLGRLLAAGGQATVRMETRVAHFDQTLWGWQLADSTGLDLGVFDALVLTPPAPQTAELVEASRMDATLREVLSAGRPIARCSLSLWPTPDPWRGPLISTRWSTPIASIPSIGWPSRRTSPTVYRPARAC
ncbi:MAG: FAD-dependent oxidoreductase [Ardenticatenaceae bacterium]|nr:FAD-dependent oxidoreductase [Ardenticatenaceae bacterium]